MRDNFALGLLVGGFLLASWVDSRVGDSRPAAPMRRIYHALAGVIVLLLSVGGLNLVHGLGVSEPVLLLAVFGLFLPALVYALLTALWVVRTAAELRHSFR